MVGINPKLLHLPLHNLSKLVGSPLSKGLRKQYGKRNSRVIKGDTVKVMRGEYKGIEGKVEKINTERNTMTIEGIQREKIRGGNVKIQIHSSNVMITSLNLDDKIRERRLKDNHSDNLKTNNRSDEAKSVQLDTELKSKGEK